ncbi:type II secretion system protein [Achromobacter sp. GG226]|uniref:type II secretion system protein n=1 Tax=Verticiella alkaliphila TaxID=2779529 RepID=UPI001C0DADD3|nr:type II secretion system protein [Verticiella sp. GG226]MBU4610291.1 type II secretion system protein [Verticiella sp. GG226]
MASRQSHSHAPAFLQSLRLRKQAGFSLVEVGVVTVILIIVAIIGLPAINGFVIENRAPKVAGELQRFVARTKASAEGGGPTPFANINNANNLVKALRTSSVVKANEDTSVIAHRLGGQGSGTNGVLTVAPATLAGGGAGSAFALTLTNVNEAACPSLASIMQQMSDQMSINGTVVKALGTNNEAGAYNAVAAEEQCVAGDNNTFVFVSR